MLCVNYNLEQLRQQTNKLPPLGGKKKRVIFFNFDCKHEIFNDFLTLLIPLRSTVTLT